MHDSQVILYCSTRCKNYQYYCYNRVSLLVVVQQSYCYTTANYQTTVVLNELDVQNEWEENTLCSRLFDTASCIGTQSMCPATHDGGYFSSSLQQRMGDIFFRISLTADGPQRTRLPVPRTATSPSCLWSRSQNKINNFVKK